MLWHTPAWVGAVALGVAQLGAASNADVDPDCGAHCLYVAARAFQRGPIEFAEFKDLLPPSQTGGYSLADLQTAAESLALKAKAVDLDPELMDKLDFPFVCIALIESHYVLVVDIDGADLIAVDAGQARQCVISATEWDGAALLVSIDEIRLPGSGIPGAAIFGLLAAVLLAVWFWRRGRKQ